MKSRLLLIKLLLAPCFAFYAQVILAQGVTTASMSGVISGQNNEELPGATVLAIHEPSGTQYGVATREDGRFNIPAMRVGGPYTVTVSYVGFESKQFEGINLKLGQAFVLDASLNDSGTTLEEVEVIGERNPILNDERHGAATNISNEVITSMPTISRSFEDFTRLTPQSSGRSFSGQDSRFNNLTIDGSIFNNSFGLSSTPGGQTNSTPISLDAIEQIQINIAPYDVRQGGFTGAGINAITRSGDNEIKGSAFYNFRNESMVGDEARENEVVTNEFDVKQYGFRLGGPIIKNKLFFFVNGEWERRSDPNSAFVANSPGRSDNNVTRVDMDDLDGLRDFLINQYDYNPGAYEGYSLATQSDKLLARLDWNINRNNKFSIRYNQLKSFRDVPTSQSGSFSGRRDNLFALNFQNSNYIINNDIYSIIAELNSTIGNKFSNNVIAGFTANRDYRSSGGGVFPLVDILEDGRNYTTFGYEPFTPNNILNTDTWQFQNNFTAFLNKHVVTAGVNFEAFKFENTFTPTYYGQFVFNSLDDFYASAAGEEVELRRYALTYSALPGGALPTATTNAYQVGAYIQDEINVNRNLKVTAGLRVDVPFFGNSALRNVAVEDLDFMNPDGNTIHLRTDRLPDANPLWSPRFGFNWDVNGDRSLQIRGGSGLFAGRPAFVWISNIVGNNGILTGSIREDNTTDYPFTNDIDAYIPANAATPSSYSINLVEDDFKFPQVWRTNLAVDKELFAGYVGTFEAIYNRNLTNVFYYNANQTAAVGNLVGPDTRPLFAGNDAGNRINNFINDATVLANYKGGYSYSLTGQIQKSFTNGFFLMAAYNFSEAKDIQSAGSQAYSSFRDNRTVFGNNNPGLAFSNNDQRHRVIGSLSYRKEYAKSFASQISMFYEARNLGRFSYTYNGDANQDQLFGNDLLYIPTASELGDMQFEEITDEEGNVIYSAEVQRNSLEQYIQQDDYLSENRGGYAERNGALLPWVSRMDISFVQEFFINVGDKRNTLQFRADIFNFGNLLNSNWGVSGSTINSSPISIEDIGDNGVPTYQLQETSGSLNDKTFRFNSSINDVWQMQLGLRYVFN